jgi:hypothetical protein
MGVKGFSRVVPNDQDQDRHKVRPVGTVVCSSNGNCFEVKE